MRARRISVARALALAALLLARPATAQVPAPEPAQPGPAVDAPGHSTETAALIAEIEAANEGDLSADPAGDIARLLALRERVEANAQVPPIERGLLASALGGAYFYTRDYAAAARELGEAGRLFEQGGAPRDEVAGLYNNQATVLASMGELAAAEGVHRRALAIRQEIEGGRGRFTASSLFGLGYVYFRQGRVEESIPLIRESVEQHLEFVGAENPLTIMRMTSLGSVLGRSGREGEALDWTRRAEMLGREHLGDEHPTYAIALNNLGNALIENGLYAEAIPVLRETLRVRRQTVGEDASGTGISLRNLATALKQAGALQEAEEINRQAIAIFEASGETDTPDALGYMYADLADFAARRGDWAAYDTLAARAMAEADSRLSDMDANRAQVHLYHADKLRRRERYPQALAIAERWVPVMQAQLIPTHPDRIWAEALLAGLMARSGQEAASGLDQLIGRLAGKLTDLTIADSQLAREARTHGEAAVLLFEGAQLAGRSDLAFEALQLANISDLTLGQQFAAQADDDGAHALARALRHQIRDGARLAAELTARQAAALEAGDAALSRALDAELAAARAQVALASERLAAEHPDFLALVRPRPVALADLAGRLDAGDVLLAVIEGESAAWALRIANGRAEVRLLDRAALFQHVAALRRAVDSPGIMLDAFPYADAAALHAMLLGDAPLPADARVLLYGGQSLASLPLGLLLTRHFDGPLAEAPWLVRRAATQVIGNLALFDGTARRAAPASSTFAGIGGVEMPDVVAQSDGVELAGLFRSGRPAMATIAELPALAGAAGELAAIARALPGRGHLLLVGPDAAEERVKQADLSRAGIIAFATHGLVAGEVRGLWEPALLLGTGDPASGEDGLLGASEIARLRLSADWVILSACNTAAGADGAAPVYSGLAAAFAPAGARALMLSHWRVRDDAAAFLTVETVSRAAAGAGRAEALRQAQLALIAHAAIPGAAHPAIWAPFVLVEN